jgi:hypothetical protein
MSDTTPSDTSLAPDTATTTSINWLEVWQITRALLVVWAVAIWGLLILLPGAYQITDLDSATLHLPYMLIGLVLVGAVFAAYKLQATKPLFWFLSVLCLLAGWV